MRQTILIVLVVAMAGCGGGDDRPGPPDFGVDFGLDLSLGPFDAGGDPVPICEPGVPVETPDRRYSCPDGWVPTCLPGEDRRCMEGIPRCSLGGVLTSSRMLCVRAYGDGSVPPSCDVVNPVAPTTPTCITHWLAVTCLDTVNPYAAGPAWCQDDTGQRFVWEPVCPAGPGGSVMCLEDLPACSLGGGVPLPDPPTCVRRGCYRGDPQSACQR